MAKIRSWPGKQGFPAIEGRVMVDTWRGQMRIRKWPRKRGTPKSEQVRQQNEWFKRANQRAKNAPPEMIVDAMEGVKGSGLYPRDILVRAMGVGILDPIEPDGQLIQYQQPRIDAMNFAGFIIRPTSNINIGTGVEVAPTWPLPQRDTANFWNAGAPTYVTVPDGVTVMAFMTGSRQPAGVNANLDTRIRRNGAEVAFTRVNNAAALGAPTLTGPMVVAPGDTIAATFFQSGGGILMAGPTFFAGFVLESA